MKVYYEFNDGLVEQIDIDGADSDNASRAIHMFYERLKYMTMWVLRHLEQVINSEGGMIILNRSGKIELKGFTPDTEKRIIEVLEKSFEYE